MSNTLLPCPFCGGEANTEEIPGNPFTDEQYAWGVGCKECNIGWYTTTKEEAFAKWNRRANLSMCDISQYAESCEECGFCVQQENKPLTLDELREMKGDPLWIGDTCMMFNEVVCDMVTFWTFGSETSAIRNINTYGKTWLAYRRKPKEEHNEAD